MRTVSSPKSYLAIYCRLSRAINGQVESVDRQERWGREYAAQHLSHLPIKVFSDNDVSAFDDDAVREDYERLRACVRAGEVDAIWCVEQTRLEANRRRWVELVAELDDAGIGEIHTNRDGLVRLDEVADIKQILAWHERKRLRERVNDTLADHAKAGRPGPGRGFGYRHYKDGTRSRIKLVENEAEAARWAADAVLSGWGDDAVAAEFERLRLPCRQGGKRWTGTRIRQMLTAPMIAGKRVYRGEVVGDAEWEAILDEVTWRRLVALYGSRKGSRPARYLLSSGLAVCGVCDVGLAGQMHTAHDTGRKRRVYSCRRNLGGCGGVSVSAVGLEDHVERLVLTRLSSAEFRDRLAASDTGREERERLVAEIAGIDSRRRELAARWARRDLRSEEWDAARDTLASEQSRLQALLAAVPAPVTDIDPGSVTADWGEMNHGEKRYVLERMLSRVVVHKATSHGPVFDTDRVKVHDINGELIDAPKEPGPPWSDDDMIEAVRRSGAGSKTSYNAWRKAQDRPWPSTSGIEHRLGWNAAKAAARQ